MRNAGLYIVVIIIVIIVGLVLIILFHNIYPPLKKHNDTVPPAGQVHRKLNRSIQNIMYSRHARCRMECRDITEREIQVILQDGIINYKKSDLDDNRGAEYAVEGYGNDQQHLRIIFSQHNNRLVVVTCIDLDKEWACDCK